MSRKFRFYSSYVILYFSHVYLFLMISFIIQTRCSISKLDLPFTLTYTPAFYLHTAPLHNSNNKTKQNLKGVTELFMCFNNTPRKKSHCHFQQYILNYSFFSEDLTFRLGLNTQCPSGPLDCSLFSACQEDTSLDYFLWEVGKQAPRSVS